MKRDPAPDALPDVKPWTCSINHGPDGEQHYANVYDGDKCLVGNLRIHHAVTVVETVNAIAAERARADKAESTAKELSDTLLTLRPLGGSECFRGLGDGFLADPMYFRQAIEKDRTTLRHWREECGKLHGNLRVAESTNADLVAQIAAKDELLQMADRFCVGNEVWLVARGEGLWAIWDHGEVLNTAGEWEPEPFPSNRDIEFQARTRFRFDEAMSRAREARLREALETQPGDIADDIVEAWSQGAGFAAERPVIQSVAKELLRYRRARLSETSP